MTEAAAPYLLTVATKRLQASPTNLRKHFDPEQIDELAESLKQLGVLQPLLVRPAPGKQAWPFPTGGDDGQLYEIIAGERRWRAATQAGIESVPVLVRELNDAQVLELQVVENLQRADLHPLEEAAGYELLRSKHGYTGHEIAFKVGKSESYVYQRMQLNSLTAKCREAFEKGAITPAVALLLARVPVPSLQDKLITAVAMMPPASAREHIKRHATLRLASAPWPLSDETLAPAVGACTECPHRTGNAPLLFPDLDEGEDLCTEPGCYEGKKKLWTERRIEELKAKGATFVDVKLRWELMDHDWLELDDTDHDLDVEFNDDNSDRIEPRTLRELLGGYEPPPVYWIDPHDGQLVALVHEKDPKVAKLSKAAQALYERQQKARRDAARENADNSNASSDATPGTASSWPFRLRKPVLLPTFGSTPDGDIVITISAETIRGTLTQLPAVWRAHVPNDVDLVKIADPGQLATGVAEHMSENSVGDWLLDILSEQLTECYEHQVAGIDYTYDPVPPPPGPNPMDAPATSNQFTFEVGERVRVNKPGSANDGREGSIKTRGLEGKGFVVTLDGKGGKRVFSFLEAELVAIAATEAAA